MNKSFSIINGSYFRVNGALRHFPEFGRAYGCKAGSAMARKEVCEVF